MAFLAFAQKGVAVLATLFCLTSLHAFEALSEGSDLRFDLFDRNDGLSSLSISHVLQDKRGFMWLGTQGGLNRFDGKNVREFRHEPFNPDSLPHNLIQTMHYDATEDVIWIGTYGGLSRFDIATGSFTNIAHVEGDERSLASNLVIAIQLDGRYLWVGTSVGLDRYDLDEETIRHYAVPGDVVRALHVDSGGLLWVGSYGGLSRYDETADQIVPVEADLPADAVMSIHEEADGALLLGCWGGGLVRFERGPGVTSVTEFADNRIYAVLPTESVTWVGTWGGGLFAVTQGGEVRRFRREDGMGGIAHDVVYALFQDASDNLWIGTNGGGVNLVSPEKRDLRVLGNDPDDPESLPYGKINALLRDRSGNLWVGVYDGGISVYDSEYRLLGRYRHDDDDPRSLADDTVNAVYESADGEIWVCSHGGLQRFDPASNGFLTWGLNIREDRPLPGSIVYAVDEDDTGRMWIGTYNNGCVRYDPETNEMTHYRHGLVYDIHVDGAGRVWVATNDGLNMLEPTADAFRSFTHDPEDPTSLSSTTARVLLETTAGDIWIGTSTGGLNRWRGNGQGFYHFTETDGLSDNAVEGLLESNDGRIFAGTQRGITSYDPQTGQVTIIDRNAGLHGIEFNSGHFKDRDGALLFGGSHGVTRIPPDFLLRERKPPRVHIVDVQVYHKSLDLHRPSYNGTDLMLGANERAVSFSYIALDYAAPANLEYRYILEGVDDGWVSAGERTFVSYTHLPPGTYTFRVGVAGPFPISGSAEASLTVSVPVPAWRRWWAFIIYGAAFVLLAYGGLRLYEAAALKEKNEALAEANRMLEVANEELGRLAVNDPLTSVYNRRYFEDRVNEQIARSRRHRESLAVVMVDVDHFKQYNDERGHVAGDECLREIATVLRSAVGRAGDFVSRYGGEEFALLLVDSELDGAAAVAEGVRKRVERDTEVTISAGVYATVPDGSTTRELMVRNADRALYRAKQDGRNRIALCRDRAAAENDDSK